MKPFPTILIFMVLLFGVGWTSRDLTEQIGDRPGAGRKRHGRSSFRGRFPAGPLLGQVDSYADQLALTADQRQRLETMIQEVTEEVREHERSIRDCIYETKGQVAELLTEEQKQTLRDLNRQQWEKYRARKLERTLEWLGRETSLDKDGLAAARSILEDHEEARKSSFRKTEKDGSSRSREGQWNERRGLTAERDQKLGELLSEEELERFQNSGLERRHSSDRGKRRHRNGWNSDGK